MTTLPRSASGSINYVRNVLNNLPDNNLQFVYRLRQTLKAQEAQDPGSVSPESFVRIDAHIKKCGGTQPAE